MPDIFSFGPHKKPLRLAGLALLASRFCRRGWIQIGDLLKVRLCSIPPRGDDVTPTPARGLSELLGQAFNNQKVS